MTELPQSLKEVKEEFGLFFFERISLLLSSLMQTVNKRLSVRLKTNFVVMHRRADFMAKLRFRVTEIVRQIASNGLKV